MLNQKAIAEFKQIYQEEFRVLLSNEEATEKATLVLNLFKVLFKSPLLTKGDGKGENET